MFNFVFLVIGFICSLSALGRVIAVLDFLSCQHYTPAPIIIKPFGTAARFAVKFTPVMSAPLTVCAELTGENV